MDENIYTLARTVHIPKKLKMSLIKKVLTTLNRCVIRKTDTINAIGVLR